MLAYIQLLYEVERKARNVTAEQHGNYAKRNRVPILEDIKNYLQTEKPKVLPIPTCKRLRIEPFAYLRDLFTRISAHPHHRLDELLPDKWRIAQRTASSA